jgi:hypothetical protein
MPRTPPSADARETRARVDEHHLATGARTRGSSSRVSSAGAVRFTASWLSHADTGRSPTRPSSTMPAAWMTLSIRSGMPSASCTASAIVRAREVGDHRDAARERVRQIVGTGGIAHDEHEAVAARREPLGDEVSDAGARPVITWVVDLDHPRTAVVQTALSSMPHGEP